MTKSRVEKALDAVINIGLDGLGPFEGAEEIAESHLRQHGSRKLAEKRLIATHKRMVAATGFASGVGGFLTLPVAVPTDVVTFYALSARCSAAIAHLRGYDVKSEEVRSVVLLSLIGSAGAGIAGQIGVQLGNKTALAALKKLPGKVLIEINKKVGFRLFTKFGQTGVINLGKGIPLVGAGVGATVNVQTMKSVANWSRHNFPVQDEARSGKPGPTDSVT